MLLLPEVQLSNPMLACLSDQTANANVSADKHANFNTNKYADSDRYPNSDRYANPNEYTDPDRYPNADVSSSAYMPAVPDVHTYLQYLQPMPKHCEKERQCISYKQ